MNREELNRKFTLGGPILYKGLRGYVTYMDDLNDTCTIKTDKKDYHDVPYADVDDYNPASAKFHEHTQGLNLKFRAEYQHLQDTSASQEKLYQCLRDWHVKGVGTSYLVMASGHTMETLVKHHVL